MGLLCSFTAEEMGWPLVLEDYASDGTIVSVSVDYSAAFQAFVDTFLSISRDLVPVDTGYLQSTLTASCTDEEAQAETICEYAQYVEYGTWKQAAQPYFEPAIEGAYDAFTVVAEEAYATASEELADELEMIEEMLFAESETRMGLQMGVGPGAMMGGREGGMMGAMAGAILDWGYATGGLMGELVLGGIGLFLFFPIALAIYGVQESLGIITGSSSVNSSRGGTYGGDGGGGGGYPEIIIT